MGQRERHKDIERGRGRLRLDSLERSVAETFKELSLSAVLGDESIDDNHRETVY